MIKVRSLLVAILLASPPATLAAGPASWEVPAPGSCLQPAVDDEEDAIPGMPRPGQVLHYESVARLEGWLPPEIWEYRERFFHDGMNLEVGPCFRDYSAPGFFAEATQRLHGAVRLSDEGGLENHRAGLPFPPESIDPKDPDAGLKWAWNMAYRYRGAGREADVRVNIVSPQGTAAELRGDTFLIQIANRADRALDDYRYPSKMSGDWLAGGMLKNMKTGNRCAFRQLASGVRKPELFLMSSRSRKPVRIPPGDREGALTGCLIDVSIGAGLFTHDHVPSLHRWRVLDVRDVMAPLNTTGDVYPVDKNRGYGPWGISFASDRWEMRRALVLEGTVNDEAELEDRTHRFIWYLDLQTLAPLYYLAFDKDGDSAGFGYYMSRWSDDRSDYPRWADDPERPIRSLDVIASAFVQWNDQHAVRFELGNAVSVPRDEDSLQRKMRISSMRAR